MDQEGTNGEESELAKQQNVLKPLRLLAGTYCRNCHRVCGSRKMGLTAVRKTWRELLKSTRRQEHALCSGLPFSSW